MVKKRVYRQTKKFTDQEEEIRRCCGQLAEEDRECGEFKRVAQLARKTLKEKERRKAHQEGAKEGAKQHAAEAAEASAAETAAKAASEPRAAPPPPRAEPAGPAGPRRSPKATPTGLRDLLGTETMKSELTLLVWLQGHIWLFWGRSFVLVKASFRFVAARRRSFGPEELPAQMGHTAVPR